MIETARLILRPWREDDRGAFAAIINTPAMMADFGGVKDRAGIDRLFDKRIDDQARNGHSFWAVELHSGEIVGSVGIRVAHDYPGLPVEGMRELGWRIAEAHWGTGLAHEAAKAAINWGWANIDTPFLAAWTTAGNTRSWGLMERLGMTRRVDLDCRDPDGSCPDDNLIVYTMDRPQ
ncbi:GNAT family N-acetyltransferase [Sphingomonas panacisoli]|nr:GNAT family N-acetyltransferase [Sphingomonas panacisoli]